MKVNQLRAGTLLSYVNLAIGSIIPMIYTPIMLRMLGQAEYGLYSLSNSIVGYLSLLNFDSAVPSSDTYVNIEQKEKRTGKKCIRAFSGHIWNSICFGNYWRICFSVMYRCVFF